MLNLKKWLTLITMAIISSVASMFLLSHVSFASQVQICKKLKQSSQVADHSGKAQKKVFCSIKPKTGKVGDYVEIKNQYNYIVATGRVVKHSRTSSIIVLKQYDLDLGTMHGFPVMLRNNDSQDYWTATTAPF